jgi:predicted ATP-binding protein involved in virulence
MKIDKIVIENFKGFPKETFHLNPQFTVFIGDNAKGKTSILDALAVAAGSYLRGIDVARSEARGIDKNEIRIVTINNDPKPQLPAIITAFGVVDGYEVPDGWYRNVDEITKKTTTKFFGAKNIEDIAATMLKNSRSGEKVIFPVLAYHGTGRLWAEHEIQKLNKEKQEIKYKKQDEGVAMAYLRCLSPKSSSKEFLSWYKTFEDEIRKFELESDKLLLKVFNECIVSMIPNNQWHDMAFSFKDDDLIGIFITPKGDNEKLLFKQLSDGYRNMIGMVADIAYRCIKLNPHLGENAIKETPGIVLIDEIDLHLHPTWQKRIVEDFKRAFPRIQFVATTHSPFIVQSLKSDELRNLDEVKGLDEDPDRYSIEEVSSDEMGIENVERSNTFIQMQNDAKEYFDLIKAGAAPELIQRAKIKLDELRIKYNNDPAYVALLESELPK